MVINMNIVLLDRASLGADTPISRLNSLGNTFVYDATAADEVCERVKDANILIINKIKITEQVLKSAKNLKLICVFATGYDNIDIEAAKRYGVGVCNVPGYSSESVALFTVTTALSLFTHLREYNDFVRSGEYTDSGIANRLIPVYHELYGKKWGIIGYGGIGKAVGRIAEGFGAQLLVNKRTKIEGVRCVDIDTLCRESDIITIHCPLTDLTREMINKERIGLMKPSVVIVNAARGAVVNEKDISEAVISGRIGGFSCDVYSIEPFGKDHPYNEIKSLPNVLLTPHAAWGAYEARERCLNIIIDNIKAFFSGEILNRVDN